MPPIQARPLVCVRAPHLLDDVLRLAAAGCAEVDLPADPIAASAQWADAPLVIVGADVGAEYVAARLPYRPNLVLVADERSTGPDDESVWRVAAELGAEHVVFLPTAETWLVDRYAEAVAGPAVAGRVIAVVGGRGGAGASVLAAALAVTAARDGAKSMLLDADPLGGGLDLLLGREGAAGLRWPDLADPAGRRSPLDIEHGLARIGELCVLSWDRGDLLSIPAQAAESALAAGRRESDLVVVDLPRRPDEAAVRILMAADLTLLVVPAEMRACAAASRVALMVAPHCARLSCVVRGPAPVGLRARDLADSLGLPLAGFLRPEPRLAAALERGEAPASTGRGPLADFCRRILADLAVPA